MGAIKTTITRYHDFSYGHRIIGTNFDTNRCNQLHGHNARIYFTVSGTPDASGHIIGFEDMKRTYCEWLEANWDHKMLLSQHDNLFRVIGNSREPTLPIDKDQFMKELGLVKLPCNPTTENLAMYLLLTLQKEFTFANAKLTAIKWQETRKCSVEVEDLVSATKLEC